MAVTCPELADDDLIDKLPDMFPMLIEKRESMSFPNLTESVDGDTRRFHSHPHH